LSLYKLCNCVGCIFEKLKVEIAPRATKNISDALNHVDIQFQVTIAGETENHNAFFESYKNHRLKILEELELSDTALSNIDIQPSDDCEHNLNVEHKIPHVEVRRRRKVDLKMPEIPSYVITSALKSTFWNFVSHEFPKTSTDVNAFVERSSMVGDADTFETNDMFNNTTYDLIVLPDDVFDLVQYVAQISNSLFVNDLICAITFVNGVYSGDANNVDSHVKKQTSKQHSQEPPKDGVYVTAKLIPTDFFTSDIVKTDAFKTETGDRLCAYYNNNECIYKTNAFGFNVQKNGDHDVVDKQASSLRGVSMPMRYGVFDSSLNVSLNIKHVYDECVKLDGDLSSESINISKNSTKNVDAIYQRKTNIIKNYDYRNIYKSTRTDGGDESSDDDDDDDISSEKRRMEGNSNRGGFSQQYLNICECSKRCQILTEVNSKTMITSCDAFNKYNVLFFDDDDGAREQKNCVVFSEMVKSFVKQPTENAIVDTVFKPKNIAYNSGCWFLSKSKVSGKEHPVKKWSSKIQQIEKQTIEKRPKNTERTSVQDMKKVDISDVRKMIKPSEIDFRDAPSSVGVVSSDGKRRESQQSTKKCGSRQYSNSGVGTCVCFVCNYILIRECRL